MDEQKKPFDTTSTVLLTIVSGMSDISDGAAVLFFAVPVIGQVVFGFDSFVISPIVWAIIQFSFIMKTGMGRPSLIAVVGGLGNIANIPGSETITTLIAIKIANSPLASRIASVASGAVATKGIAAGAEKNVAEAGTKGVGSLERAESGEKETGAGTRRDIASEKEMGEGEDFRKRGGAEPEAKEKDLSEALGETPTPFEDLEKLTSETPEENQENERGNDVQVDGNKVYL